MREQYFAPGRIELAGNHTDHQKGRVLAAAADRGITAQVEPNLDGMIRIVSEGYGVIEIDIFDLEPKEAEKGSAAALVRGVAGAMDDAGARIGGFDASLVSALRPGGGLSSSAAFSVLIGKILNGLYNGGRPGGGKPVFRQAQRLYGSVGLRAGKAGLYRLYDRQDSACNL